MTRAFQIAMHTQALRRWFGPAEARQRAAQAVDSGNAWKWTDPQQLELFA